MILPFWQMDSISSKYEFIEEFIHFPYSNLGVVYNVPEYLLLNQKVFFDNGDFRFKISRYL